MKTNFCIVALAGIVIAVSAGCAGGVGVYGETDGVYYGPDNGPWFSGGEWVHGRRWNRDDHDHDHREINPPPRGDHGPHLPNAPRPPSPPHASAPPRAPSAPRPEPHH